MYFKTLTNTFKAKYKIYETIWVEQFESAIFQSFNSEMFQMDLIVAPLWDIFNPWIYKH